MRPSIGAVFVKVCGVTNEDDALLAVAMDADAIGFNFVSGSIRQIAPVVARDIVRRLPPEMLTVGVFRDAAPERVVQIVDEAGLRGAQLHGRETPETTRYVSERVPFVIKAFVDGDPGVARAAEHGVEHVMLDGARPGSGETWSWDTSAVPPGLRVILAGGLSPDNVGAAVTAVEPWGVDAASGLERPGGDGSPGRKDPRKVRLFVANARAAAVDRVPGADALPYDWVDDT